MEGEVEVGLGLVELEFAEGLGLLVQVQAKGLGFLGVRLVRGPSIRDEVFPFRARHRRSDSF